MTKNQKRMLSDRIYIAGFTLKSLSNEISVTPQYLSKIVNGIQRPSPQMASRIAEAIEMDPREFRSLFCDEVA